MSHKRSWVCDTCGAHIRVRGDVDAQAYLNEPCPECPGGLMTVRNHRINHLEVLIAKIDTAIEAQKAGAR
jgi:DNA-directed RNA polymerase subunit RPC12/RpoP